MVLVKEILVMNNTWDLNTIVTIYHTYEGEVEILKRDTVYNLIRDRPQELEYKVKFFTSESIKVCLPDTLDFLFNKKSTVKEVVPSNKNITGREVIK